MKDGMNNLFRDRFQGHESPVDPGIWTGIQQQVAVAASGTDGFEDLFKERFHGHESTVDPSVWQGISSQLGHGVAISSTTGSMGWAAAGAAVIAIGVLGYFLVKESSTEVTKEPMVELVLPSTSTTDQEPAPDQEVDKPLAKVQVVDQPIAAEVVKVLPKERVVAPRIERSPVEPNANATPDAHANSSTNEQPEDFGSIPPEIAAEDPLDRSPKPATDRVDAPEKVESIIRKLTDEVQMEVLNDPEQTKIIVGSTSPIDGETEDVVAADRILAPLPKLFMPNTFTPNGDAINDTYTLAREGFRSMMVRVYSMKNDQLVFSTNNGEAWTGDRCEDGMYMVAVEAVTDDGRTMTEGKVVWLTRVRLN